VKRLMRAQIALGLIAQLAGVTPNAIRNRLRPPDKHRRKPKMNGASPKVRRSYLKAQRRRQRDYQRQSLKYAESFGPWTRQEIRYIEKNAAELTRLEIAINLQRTYYAVSHYINRHGIKTRK
jgi:hypothetical protein